MDIEDIGDIDQKIKEVNEKLKDFMVDPDTITTYLLGLTGSGKSTLTNYMMGANLSWKKSKGKYEITNDDKDNYPAIGNTLVSCTDIPSIYRAEGICFVDPAGFLDTKGPTQETINSYANAKMFKRGGKTKILLIFEQSTLFSARGGSLVDVAVRLRELFPGDFNNLVHSIMIIVTKANTEDLTEEDAMQNISQIISTNRNLPPECKMMIDTIIQFKRVALFPIPKYMTPQKIETVKERIQNLKHCTLAYNATISLSPAAKIKLDDMARDVGSTINDCSKTIRAEIQAKFVNKFYKTSQEIEPVIGKIRQALSILTLELDSGNMQSFQKFAKFIDLSQEIEIKVKENYEKIEFCKTLHTDIKTNIKLVDSVINCLKEALGQLESELQKISTKEQIEQMNKKHEKALQDRRKQFKQMNEKMEKDALKREKQARQNLKRQRTDLKNAMDQSNKQYQKSMDIMQKQLEQIKNRPPQIIERKKGWCSIM